VEHVDEFARLGESELAAFGGIAAEPPDGGAFVGRRVVVAEESIGVGCARTADRRFEMR
jgi:hypothetical protein